MTFSHIMQDIARAKGIIAIAEKVWAAITADHADTHALGQALIEAGQELQGEDPVALS